MRTALVLASLLISQVAFAGESVRTVTNFTTIKAKGAFNMVVEVGKNPSVVVKGSNQFADRISTEVVGDELRIMNKDHKNNTVNSDDQVIITVPALNRIKVEGVGATTVSNLNNKEFEIEYEGVGKLVASGKSTNLRLSAKGVGMVDAKQLVAEQVSATLDGVGSVDVHAKNQLSASVHGIGSLTYYGKPKTVSKTADGIGSIRAGD
ncbi:GIN domain-containing protein [Undibacterium squillarum]|uniref:Putative auto-transporter adhesin head GIN domain-containing protein n=1 Tax=Undibacterium squillarum TaxID=1131567 RepID=A0ABQ2XRH9_9BURK|nr:DUF2807 domain-containing protein [Undibacterium squillarum]GGX29478.1 hypothetical protein GCM10010946_03010 [Undibacterium squillarum]